MEFCFKRTLILSLMSNVKIWELEKSVTSQTQRTKRSGKVSIFVEKYFAIMLSVTRLRNVVSNAGLTC